MLFTTSEEEWDAVIRVHLKGHFAVDAPRGRVLAPAQQGGRDGRRADHQHVFGGGLMGSVGQATYSRGQGRIAALTLVEAAEMARYGVTANAIAPRRGRA